MSVARPAARGFLSRCVVSVSSAPAPSTPLRGAPAACHHFHSSSQLQVRRRSRFKSVRAEQMGLVTPQDIENFAKDKFPAYTPEEKEALNKVYSAEQIAALEAGEAAIDPKDLTIQGRLRVDPYRLPYIDDFRDVQPIVDKRPRIHPPPDPKAKFMNVEEFTDDLIKWTNEVATKRSKTPLKKLEDFIPESLKALPEAEWTPEVRQVAADKYAKYIQKHSEGVDEDRPDDHKFFSYLLNRSSMTDNNAQSNSHMAPALPNKVPGVAGLYQNILDPEDEGLDDAGSYKELKKQTGLTVKQLMNLSIRPLVIRHVANKTRLGTIRSSSVMTVAGNRQGWLGIGMAKSTDPKQARETSMKLAIRNMQPVPRYENRTIYGNVEGKVGGTVVQLFARPPGFGLRVSHRIFEMARAAGISDLAGKMPRRRNPMNTVKACYEALMRQKMPDEIAIGRGKKMVDVRKVYYGGRPE